MNFKLKKGFSRDKVIALLCAEGERTGKLMLEKAISDGRIDEKEITRLNKVYGARRDEVSEIFKVFYDTGIQVDGGDNKVEKKVMVTMKGSGIWNMRDYIKEKYDMAVLSPDEAKEFMLELQFKMRHK